jgi:hypothetical protein
MLIEDLARLEAILGRGASGPRARGAPPRALEQLVDAQPADPREGAPRAARCRSTRRTRASAALPPARSRASRRASAR